MVSREISDRGRRWWTLAGMCCALFMSMLDSTVVIVALPSIQRDFHAGTASLEWALNAYTLTFAVLLVTGGRLGDLFGRVRVFTCGVLLFTFASVMIALSPGQTWLVGFRALQGAGAAFMMPGTLSIITNAFPRGERGKAIGVWAGVSGVALAIGPVVGGLLVEEIGWRSIFLLNVPVAIAALGITLTFARESRDEDTPRRIDLPGVAALTVALTALVVALVESNTWGWGSARVLGLFALAAAGLCLFALIESRVSVPMVDFDLFRSPTFFGANTVAFLVSFVMFSALFSLTLYVQDVLDYSPLQAGVRFLSLTVLVMLTAPIAGWFADRVGPKLPLTAGMVCVAGSLFLLTGISPDSGYESLLGPLVLMGLGIGMVIPPMSTAVMNSVDESKAGLVSGVLGMTRMIGSTFGVASFGAIVASVARTRLAERLPALGPDQRASLVDHLGTVSGAASHLPAAQLSIVNDTYVQALTVGFYVVGGLALVGALIGATTVSGAEPAALEPAALDGT